MTKSEYILFRLLCTDLGWQIRRVPSLFELDIAKGYVVLCSDVVEDRERFKILNEWIDSWCVAKPAYSMNDLFIRDIYQIVCFLLKIKKGNVTDDQEHDYLDNLQATFASNRAYIVPKHSNVIRIAKKLVRFATSTVDMSIDAVLRHSSHGPGATFERAYYDDKSYYLLTNSRTLRAVFGDCWMMADPMYPFMTHCYNRDTDYGCAQLALVPKTWKGPRGVYVQPTSFVFLQKGIERILRNRFLFDPIFRSFWNPLSQAPNQEASHLGASSQIFATLDLKDASDRITLQLVNWLFHRQDYKVLASTRVSHVILPSGKTVKSYLFAPMGDGKTFPLLTYVCVFVSLAAMLAKDGILPTDNRFRSKAGIYSLIRKYSREDSGLQPDTVNTGVMGESPSTTGFGKLRVFGDDIAVDPKYFDAVCDGLRDANLVINRSKSFSRGAFRESCGFDAFNCVEITPLRWKVDLDSKCNADMLASLIATHNRIALRYPRFIRLRLYAERRIHSMARTLKVRVGYTSRCDVNPTLLYCDAYASSWGSTPISLKVLHMNRHLPMRFNADLQRIELRCFNGSTSTEQYCDPYSDWYRYNYALFPSSEPCGFGEWKTFTNPKGHKRDAEALRIRLRELPRSDWCEML